ncbi:MAG: hypothetical protein V4458_12755 [Pseudomonadota bacterium]
MIVCELTIHEIAEQMRTIVVFYAWQGDRPNNLNRSFIEKALDDAAKKFNAASASIKIEIDQDTQGVPGTPPVSETILSKISSCDIFLPDLTLVAQFQEGKKQGKLVPNPNVLIEYGYALRAKGHQAMMPVMNTAYGEPEDLPFDMKHLRHPIQYYASIDNSADQLRTARERLSNQFLSALQILAETLPAEVDELQITKDLKQHVQGFHSQQANVFQQLIPVQLVAGPKLVLHLYPAAAYEEAQEIRFASVEGNRHEFMPFDYTKQISRPDTDSWMFHDPLSAGQNGIFPVSGRFEPLQGQCRWFCQVSRHGVVELIAMIDTIGMPSDQGPIAIDGTMLEALIVNTVERLATGLSKIGITQPAILRISLLEVANVTLLQGTRGSGRFNRQPIQLPEIVLTQFAPPLANDLRPLIDAIYRAAGIAAGTPSFNSGKWAGY